MDQKKKDLKFADRKCKKIKGNEGDADNDKIS